MKDMDGLEATACLKSSFREVRIVILTEYNGSDLREAAHVAGASAYALKEDLRELPALLSCSNSLLP